MSLRSPPQATPQSGQTPPHSLWRNTWGPSRCARGPGSALAPLRRGGGSGTPGWGVWGGTPSPGRAGASPPPPSPPRTATRCQGSGKRSRSWQREGALGWGWLSCTCCTLQPSRSPWCGGQQSVCRSRRAPRSWSRRPSWRSALCPGPSCPFGGCRLGRSSGQLDLWVSAILVRKRHLSTVYASMSGCYRGCEPKQHAQKSFDSFTCSPSSCVKVSKTLTGWERRGCAHRENDKQRPQYHPEGVVAILHKVTGGIFH